MHSVLWNQSDENTIISLSHFMVENEITRLGRWSPKHFISNFPTSLKELKDLLYSSSTLLESRKTAHTKI